MVLHHLGTLYNLNPGPDYKHWAVNTRPREKKLHNLRPKVLGLQIPGIFFFYSAGATLIHGGIAGILQRRWNIKLSAAYQWLKLFLFSAEERGMYSRVTFELITQTLPGTALASVKHQQPTSLVSERSLAACKHSWTTQCVVDKGSLAGESGASGQRKGAGSVGVDYFPLNERPFHCLVLP